MAVEAYPLSWPAGWPRTAANKRKHGKFMSRNQWITTATSVDRVLSELRRFGVDRRSVILSSNVEAKSDGLPRSDRNVNLVDPGAAVYWTDPETKQQQCIAIDQYTWVSDNFAAIAATLDSMRAIERHGGAQILKRAFEGFKALPSSTTPAFTPAQAAESVAARIGWRSDVILSDREHAKNALRLAMSKTHPDAGGAQHDFQMVQEAKRVLSAHHGVSL
jgi:hypothetical protein